MSLFKQITPDGIPDNVFALIRDRWMLITAGDGSRYNTMTASWGGLGHIWGRDVCSVVVRPVRETYKYTEAHDRFTLSFFDEQWRDALKFCGAHSGRDTDKAAATGLTPIADGDVTYFAQASMVIIAKKMYVHDISPDGMLDASIDKNYAKKDYHRMYIAAIEDVLIR